MAAGRTLSGRAVAVLEGLAAAILLLLMLVVLTDVVGRNLLNRPLPWGTELLEVMLGAMIFLLYPVLALGGGHITVDLIQMRRSVQRVQKALAGLVGASLFGLIAVCLARQAMRAAGYGEGTPLLGIPYAVVLGGMGVLAAVAVLGFLIAVVRGWRSPDPVAHAVAGEGA